MIFEFKSIQSRIIFWAGICLLLVSGILITYSSINVHRTGEKVAEAQALALARENASTIDGQMEQALNTADTLAKMFITSKSSKISLLGRGQAIELLRGILEGNPVFLGTFTAWEPNAFDGRDAQNKNMDGHDATGRFIPYLVRTDEKIKLIPLQDYEEAGAGDYYLLPKSTQQIQVMEPFNYEVNGESILLTSLVVPIVVDGNFQGITGVDLRLDFLQSLANQAVVFDGKGEMLLVSNSGMIAAATGQPDLVGMKLIDYQKDWQEFLPVIKAGEEVSQLKNGSLLIITPVQIASIHSPWSVIVTVPEAVITADATRMMMSMIFIGSLLTVIALALLWMVALGISRPVQKITLVANALSRGELSAKVEHQSQDEVGQLGLAFQTLSQSLIAKVLLAEAIAVGNLVHDVHLLSDQDRLGLALQQMAVHLRQQVGRVAGSAASLRSAAGQLAQTSRQTGLSTGQIASTIQEVSRSVTTQSESIAKTAQSVEIMARAIHEVADGAREQAVSTNKASEITNRLATEIQQVTQNAIEVSKESMRAAENARSGRNTVDQAIQSIMGIRGTVNTSAEKVEQMGQRSEKISIILDTINDISSQTNLLALNAAIEAARAGEHGKGFAVVADEVRKLAQRSASATREIGELIHQIQTSVADAVSAMGQSAGEGEKGVSAANQAGQALNDILEAAEGVSRQADLTEKAAAQMEKFSAELVSLTEMVNAVAEQNTASMSEMNSNSIEVKRLIENIACISEENSAAVEEVSATTDELNNQVEEVNTSAQVLAKMADDLNLVVEQFQL
jgi:methyl-accepting chemotaxis protein